LTLNTNIHKGTQCMSYTLSQPGVSTALVGVKNVEELVTFVAGIWYTVYRELPSTRPIMQ